MWSGWLGRFAFDMVLHGPPVGPAPDAYVEETVPRAVEDHLATLGVVASRPSGIGRPS